MTQIQSTTTKKGTAAQSRTTSASPVTKIDNHNLVTTRDLASLLRLQVTSLWEKKCSAALLPPLMVWGAPGLGKSSIIRDLAREYGVGFIDIRLAQREPVDIRGLPVPDKDGVKWLVSSEWPRDPDSRGIILFDELTAADRSLQVAAYELILDRRLGDLYTVPEGWYICAAGNRTEDRAVATTMSSALANRFLHVELQSDVECWIQWALGHDVHPTVIGFLRARPELLFVQKDENLERGWPSPRSWERVSSMLKLVGKENPRMLRSIVYGLIGDRAGVEFMAFLDVSDSLEDVLQAMLSPKSKVSIPKKADRIYAFCSAMVYHLWRGQDERREKTLLDGFFRLSLELPSSFAAMAMIDAMGDSEAKAEKLFSHPQYQDWAALHGVALKQRLSDGQAVAAEDEADTDR
ncbi:MAG: hypothetical protein BWX73_01130 [Lentisphaerae bacterium ADurb.Bin082]|nr:MAG: hypothetical protein BWX73_01130 [Lentisphaerae bacterium ADurb.Bin082]HQL88570.1 hypothetical protein [Lentisphaeria bacterium]